MTVPSVLIDTNIVVDVLVKRQSFVVQARQIWRACEDRRIAGYISAASMTDIFYLVGKEEGNAAAFAGLRLCVRVFRLCRVDLAEVQQALNISGDDFEDNLQ